MTKQIEKHWKDCNQPLFLLAVILNPFEGLSSFGENAGMNHFKCNNLLIAEHVSLIKKYTRHATNTWDIITYFLLTEFKYCFEK
jgi:hypothetical protein